MKIVKHIFTLLFCFFLTTAAGQDCKNPKKMRKHAQKRLESEHIIKATKFEVTFKDFNKSGTTHFAKSDNSHYLGLNFLRDFSRKMDVTPDNPMIFKLENDSLVTVYPYLAAKDRGNMGFTTPMGTKILRAYYKLSPEQVRLFASIPIKQVKLYVTLKKKGEDGTNEEDIIEFDIKKKKWRTNFMESAKCILQ